VCMHTHTLEAVCSSVSVYAFVLVGGGPGPGSVLEVEAAECAPCSTSSCCLSRNTYWITT